VYGHGWFSVHHLLYLARIHRYAFFGNSVSQELHTIEPEFAFGEFSIEFVISQMLQNNSNMFDMFFHILGIDQDIIDKNYYELVKLSLEYRVHEIHEVGWGIGETKRHH
jgi:hypothetical protein